MTNFLFLLQCKMQRKIFFCRNDVEARASVRTPSYAPAIVCVFGVIIIFIGGGGGGLEGIFFLGGGGK